MGRLPLPDAYVASIFQPVQAIKAEFDSKARAEPPVAVGLASQAASRAPANAKAQRRTALQLHARRRRGLAARQTGVVTILMSTLVLTAHAELCPGAVGSTGGTSR
eukprot:365569-Chlamydomonas_euryale.AAC.15